MVKISLNTSTLTSDDLAFYSEAVALPLYLHLILSAPLEAMESLEVRDLYTHKYPTLY